MARRKRKLNPGGSIFVAFTTILGTWLFGSWVVNKRERARARKKAESTGRPSTTEQPAGCPSGTVFNGSTCVEPTPLPAGSHSPPPPTPPVPPTPEPGLSPAPLPPNLLPGPAASPPCVLPIYERTPIRLPDDVYASLSPAARQFTHNKLYYLNAPTIRTLVKLFRERYTTWPSLRSVVVRDALASVAPGCAWYGDQDVDFTPAQGGIWPSASDLARAVELDIGWSPPDQWSDLPAGYDDAVLQRTILGLPAPGNYQLKNGQVVELLVTDGSLEYAEHLFAKITGFRADYDCYEYEILTKFQGYNVAPAFTHKHGFGTEGHGKFGCLRRTTGGAYRVYQLGVT